MRLVRFLLLLAAASCAALAVLAEPVKTVTVEDLLKREQAGRVVIDDKRGVAYFEMAASKASPSASLPYAFISGINSALKKIYAAPLGGEKEAKLLFQQGEDAGTPKHYPLVVIPYAGTSYKTDPTGSLYAASIWDTWLSWNTAMQLFAAHGYTVLMPSIPFTN